MRVLISIPACIFQAARHVIGATLTTIFNALEIVGANFLFGVHVIASYIQCPMITPETTHKKSISKIISKAPLSGRQYRLESALHKRQQRVLLPNKLLPLQIGLAQHHACVLPWIYSSLYHLGHVVMRCVYIVKANQVPPECRVIYINVMPRFFVRHLYGLDTSTAVPVDLTSRDIDGDA
jgi:hypothetical protein